jgi:hypothetical protein
MLEVPRTAIDDARKALEGKGFHFILQDGQRRTRMSTALRSFPTAMFEMNGLTILTSGRSDLAPYTTSRIS